MSPLDSFVLEVLKGDHTCSLPCQPSLAGASLIRATVLIIIHIDTTSQQPLVTGFDKCYKKTEAFPTLTRKTTARQSI